MPLPTCLCVAGLPVEEKLNAIYCALDAIVNGSDSSAYLLKAQNLADVADVTTARDNLGSVSGVWPVSLGGTGQSVLYKFSAFKPSDQALTASSTTKITFGTEEYDVGGAFASSTFTAPVDGKYLFGAAIQTTGASATQAVYLYKNGSQFKRLSQRAANSGDMLSGSVTVDLVAGNTIEIYAFTDQNVTVTGASTVTYFWGNLVP